MFSEDKNKIFDHNEDCLPCPVCGADNQVFYIDKYKERFSVVCSCCQTSTRSAVNEISAVYRWNIIHQRVTPANEIAMKLRKTFKLLDKDKIEWQTF
jgi:hypothetical protein